MPVVAGRQSMCRLGWLAARNLGGEYVCAQQFCRQPNAQAAFIRCEFQWALVAEHADISPATALVRLSYSFARWAMTGTGCATTLAVAGSRPFRRAVNVTVPG